jgi:hypothetical protein
MALMNVVFKLKSYGRSGWKAGSGTYAFGKAGWGVQGWEDMGYVTMPERSGYSFSMLQEEPVGHHTMGVQRNVGRATSNGTRTRTMNTDPVQQPPSKKSKY